MIITEEKHVQDGQLNVLKDFSEISECSFLPLGYKRLMG